MATVWLPVLCFAAIAGGIFWLAAWQAKKTRTNLQALAARRGLAFTEKKMLGVSSGFALRGAVAGRPLRFWTYSTGSGRSQVSWAAVAVQARTGGELAAEFRRRGFTTKMMALFGAKEVTFGDPVFDGAWFVQSNRPDFLRAALVPDIRDKFAAAGPTGTAGRLKIERGEARYSEQGRFSSRAQCDRLEMQIPLLQDLADLAEVSAGAGR